MASNVTSTLTADGDTAVMNFPGGTLFFGGTGTFGSGSVILKASFDGGTTFITVPNSAFTTEGVYSASLPNCAVKLTLYGATSPSLSLVLARFSPV